MKKITFTALAILVALTVNAEAKQVKRIYRDSRVAPVDKPIYDDGYRVGDPRIVYHEIGTSGAQNGNTIIACHNEPVRSTRPYEIRYDYRSMR